MKYGVISAALLLWPVFIAKVHAERPPIDPKRELQVVYGNLLFNKNRKKVDSAWVLLRDGDTGRTKWVELKETEVNSSTFTSLVELSDWADLDSIYPEVYTPTPDQAINKSLRKNFETGVKNKTISRSPIIFKSHSSGLQILDAYKDVGDMNASLENYKRTMKLVVRNVRLDNKIKQKLPSQQLIDKATVDEKILYLSGLEKKEEEQQIRRNRKQEALDKTILKRQQDRAFFAEERKKANKAKADLRAKQALEKYKAGDFAGAERPFLTAIQLDPDNMEYLFYYGVTLYRLKKYDDALVHLNLVKSEGARELERKLFVGLCYYQLAELKRASIIFRSIRATENKTFAPTAAFYEGLILYSQEQFIAAKEPFEYVLDTSEDPNLDRKAENYLEDIAWKAYYKRNRVRKWFLDLDLQFMYDSNILYSTDNQEEQGTSGLAEEKAGGRTNLATDLQRRIFYTESEELSVATNLEYYYSFNSVFKRADPFTFDIEVPYTRKEKVFNKAAQWTITPSYELLWMDAEDEGTRENIQSSGGVEASLTLVNGPSWISTYNFSYEVENSHLTDETDDGRDNADAHLAEINTYQSFYIGNGKKQALIPNIAIKQNNAEGDNKTYSRWDIGITYMNSRWWNSTIYANMTYYELTFPDHDEERQDTNFTAYIGLDKDINEKWSWGVSATHISNPSNVSSNDYTKSLFLTSFGYHWEK